MANANPQNDNALPTLNGPWAKPRSGGAAKQLIIFLHGVGADGNDLINLAHEFSMHFPDAQFVSPNAPFPCDMSPMGYQWFSLQDRDPDAMLDGADAAMPIVNQFIDDQCLMYGLKPSQVAVIGFSQGTMTALHALLRREQPVAALVGFSGALIGSDLLAEEAKNKMPVCLIHGDMDQVVPFQAMALAAEALTSAEVPHETHACANVAHGISAEGIMHALNFLKSYLPAA